RAVPAVLAVRRVRAPETAREAREVREAGLGQGTQRQKRATSRAGTARDERQTRTRREVGGGGREGRARGPLATVRPGRTAARGQRSMLGPHTPCPPGVLLQEWLFHLSTYPQAHSGLLPVCSWQ